MKSYGSRLEQFPGLVRIEWEAHGEISALVHLAVLCWPLALAALVLYPLVWLLLLPFRMVGIAVEGALGLVWAVVTLPARIVRAI